MAVLGDLDVGSIVKIKENGVKQNYIIIHKGKPSDLYDDSCDGVWLLRENPHSTRAWCGTGTYKSNNYETSDIRNWLENDFLNTIDENIRNIIIETKIPFKKGFGNTEDEVCSRENGLVSKIFLLSMYEVGYTNFNVASDSSVPIDGAKLDYFDNYISDGYRWWTRSPNLNTDTHIFFISENKRSYSSAQSTASYAIRPSFIIPSDTSLDMLVTTPTITSDKQGDLGKLDSGFTCQYSADYDDEGDITVTLNLDGKQLNTFTAVKQQEYTFSLEGLEWRKVLNGEHSFTINVSDGAVTTTREITFSKDCNRVAFELETPMPADDVISVCSVKIKGGVTTDTLLKCEVTNNANDTTPVWEDCTAKVKSEMVYSFKNKTAENGFAFNLRISAQRGASGAKGYITSVEGGFG